jgi:hypothetical protein
MKSRNEKEKGKYKTVEKLDVKGQEGKSYIDLPGSNTVALFGLERTWSMFFLRSLTKRLKRSSNRIDNNCPDLEEELGKGDKKIKINKNKRGCLTFQFFCFRNNLYHPLQ